MGKLHKYLKTVHIHRKYVRKMCWKMGIFWQGLVHDMSKYSPQELWMCRYWTGKGSPHQACREVLGYSPSWIHHYHRNKHHYQFWWDEDENGNIIPMKMPYKYVIENFCDMVGASKAYNQGKCKSGKWTPQMVYDYWVEKCEGKRIMHNESLYLIRKLIWNLREKGEEGFIAWYRHAESYLRDNYDKGQLEKADTLAGMEGNGI